MKAIFAHWLWVLFLAQESENQSEVRRSVPVQPPRRRRQVPREGWIEEESTQVDTIQSEIDQPEQIRQQPTPQHDLEQQQNKPPQTM